MTPELAPRALLQRSAITVSLSPSELFVLISALQERAELAADNGQDDFADYLFVRVAELREAAR